MNTRKLSINKACVLLGTLLLLAVGAVCTTVYLLTRNIIAVRCVFLFSLFVLLCVIFFVALIRRKLVQFSDAFCGQMDDMLSENMQPKQTACEESLFYKDLQRTLAEAVEALGDFGWGRYVGLDGTTVTMKGFGASAPAGQLFKKFGFTVENVVAAVKSL